MAPEPPGITKASIVSLLGQDRRDNYWNLTASFFQAASERRTANSGAFLTDANERHPEQRQPSSPDPARGAAGEGIIVAAGFANTGGRCRSNISEVCQNPPPLRKPSRRNPAT